MISSRPELINSNYIQVLFDVEDNFGCYLRYVPVLMRPTDCYEPLHGDGKGHVGGSADGNGQHGVDREDVHVHMGEERGFSKPMGDKLKCGIGMDWDIENDVHYVTNSQGSKELGEGVLSHVLGEEGHGGGHVGDQTKQTKTGE